MTQSRHGHSHDQQIELPSVAKIAGPTIWAVEVLLGDFFEGLSETTSPTFPFIAKSAVIGFGQSYHRCLS